MKVLDRVPRWDQHRGTFLKVGFICSLGLVFMAFNYTSYAPHEEVIFDTEPLAPDFEVTPPIMREKKQLPPPPAPKLEISPIVEPDLEPEFIDEKLPEPVEEPTDNTTVTTLTEQPAPSAPPVKLPPKVEVESGPVILAERMPVYNSCDLNLKEAERRTCTQQAMLSHIYKFLKYPAIARENGIEGTVVVSFVVDKKGNPQDLSIMKDIGGGCGAEVLRVINKLGTFTPGKQNGRPVSVIYRVPVKFDLRD